METIDLSRQETQAERYIVQAAGVEDGLKNITIERKVNGVVTTMSLSKNK